MQILRHDDGVYIQSVVEGTPAARAVHDAMPFLRKATTIDVVTINENEDTASEVSSTALITHLARHDLSVRSLNPKSL